MSTLDFPIAIVSHPDRMVWAERLAEEVAAEIISVDLDSQGCRFNHTQALKWLRDCNSEWCIVLEDDADPIPDLREQLVKAFDNAPTPIISLYLGRARPPQWQQPISSAVGMVMLGDHVSWLVGTDLIHGVGYAIKTKLIPDLLDSLAVSKELADQAISTWVKKRGHRVSYCFPSLVDHRCELPTLVKDHGDNEGRVANVTADHTQELRKAWLVGGKDDWDDSYLEIPSLADYWGEDPGSYLQTS